MILLFGVSILNKKRVDIISRRIRIYFPITTSVINPKRAHHFIWILSLNFRNRCYKSMRLVAFHKMSHMSFSFSPPSILTRCNTKTDTRSNVHKSLVKIVNTLYKIYLIDIQFVDFRLVLSIALQRHCLYLAVYG